MDEMACESAFHQDNEIESFAVMTGILCNIQGRPTADVSFYVHKNILTEMKHFRHIRCIMGERPFKESTSKMLTKEEFTCLARKYMDTVFRVAMNY